MLLQSTLGSSILQLVNPNSIVTIIIEIGILYVAYREFKIKTEKNIEAINKEVELLKVTTNKINTLENNSNMLSKDIEFLREESKNTLRILERLDEKQSVLNTDIHRIKGTMPQIEMYLKQIIEGKL
jgi:hypothetical protein